MDRESFGARVYACRNHLYKIAVAITGRESDAEDAVQEALMKAWRRQGSLREEAYFETWLVRILINEGRQILRKRKRRGECALEETVPAPQGENAAETALSRIPEAYRTVLVLRYVCGLSVAETGRALRLGEGTVKWRTEKGKRLLKAEMEEKI